MKRQRSLLSWYDLRVLEHAEQHGGFWNAHAHLCRANTPKGRYLRHIGTTPTDASSLPLAAKQNMVGNLHNGEAYLEENLYARMKAELERQIALGVRRIDTDIDATPDLPENGLLAIRIALDLKERFENKIELNIGPTPIFGFKEERDESPNRWEVFVGAAKLCDYISLLPEKDEPKGNGRIGYKAHVLRGLELGLELGKEVHLHVDQGNYPEECGAEWVLDILEAVEQPLMPGGDPWVWFIHLISPSAYDEHRFRRLFERMRRENVGVIVCPTAALSMRQLRSLNGPIHNSIARVPELIKAGIPIRMGTDNIGDVFVLQGDGDMLTEVKCASLATRITPPSIWAKFACGVRPNAIDVAAIGRILHEDRKACLGMNPHWIPAID